jgi:anti-sigma factor RsiW
MSCDEANRFIEAAAVGDALPPEVEAHIAGCRACAARLALARRIDLTLQRRPVPEPPASFTASVIRRLRDERWQAERVVDFGFNLVVAVGLFIVVTGLVGVAWQLGVVRISDDVLKVISESATVVVRRAVTDSRIVMIGMLLITTAVGVWWWAEEDTLA